MKSHYTAKELAGLPGMPKTESAVIRLAAREALPAQKRAGRGGGKEYALAALPVETQRYLNKTALSAIVKEQAVATVTAPVPAVIKPLAAPAELTAHQNKIMSARVWLMKMIEADKDLGHRLQQSLKYVANQIALGVQPFAGQAERANDRKRKDGTTLSVRSLMRYWSDWKNSGRNPVSQAPNDGDVRRVQKETALVAFVRDFGTRQDRGLLPATVPAWVPYFLSAYRKASKPSITDALRDMRTMPATIKMPSYSQVSRIVQKIPAVYIEKGRNTGAELKAIMGFNRRVWSDYHPFTVGQVDGHSFKAYVAHPVTGAHFHPEVCGIIDMTTKVLAGYSAGLAESSRTVGDAYRHACTVNDTKLVGGVFSIIEADLGAGNKAKVNADKDIGLFALIGTQLSFPEVAGNPQGHGGIERSNQSIWIRAAKELPTYTGKDMDRVTRKKIYTRLEQDLKAVEKAGELGKVEKTSKMLLSWREFLAALEIWVLEYNNTPHSALPKITDAVTGRRRHRTPYEELAYRINQGWDPQSVQLEGDMLGHLFMPHERIKVNRCEFRLHGNLYHAYELQTHHGEDMIAAYDIHDANHVWVLNGDEQLVCKAAWNGNNIHGVPMARVDQADFARTDRRIKLKERQLEMIKSEAQPTSLTEHPEEIKRERLRIAAQIEEAEIVQATVFKLGETPRDRQFQWQDLTARLEAGETLTTEEAGFQRGWQNDDYHKIWRGMNEEKDQGLATPSL